MPSVQPANRVCNAPRRFKPIGAIVRDVNGRPIGRTLHLLVERQIVAYDYTNGPPLGRFFTARSAIAAIRAKHEARR